MADYQSNGNRWTAIYVLEVAHGRNSPTYRKLPFELVRFNVDTNPDAPEEIVPCGEDVLNPNGDKSTEKIYEKIWIVDGYPWHNKVWFGKPE